MWSPRRASNARPAGDLGVAHRHKSGPALVPAHDGLDGIAIVQGIEGGKVALAGNAEHAVDAMGRETIDQQVRATTRHVQLRALLGLRSSPAW